MENFRYFLTVNRGKITTILLLIAAVLIGVMVYSMTINNTTMIWTSEDANISATEPTKLIYSVSSVDKNGAEQDVKWETTGGTLSNTEGKQVEWQLPDEEGTYTISAISNTKTISRNVTVLGNVLANSFYDEKTVVENNDSDADGLTDKYEIEVSKTDPQKADSDSDGLFDGDEVELGMDPLKEDSKGDGTIDSKRTLKYEMNQNGVSISLEGEGNITKTTVDKIGNDSLNSIKGAIGEIYNITTSGKLNTASVSININSEIVSKKGFSESNLSVYRLLENEGSFQKIDTSVDTNRKVLNFKTDSFGKFFIADSTKLNINAQKQVMFVIDNSGSMYPAEEVEDSAENDVDFKRVSLSNRLIDKLKGNYKFGAGKFTFEYELLHSMTDDREAVKKEISSIKTGIEKFTGTYISRAIVEGLKEFKNEDNVSERIMILLTDGKETTNVEGYDEKKNEEALKEANNKNVKIIVIGLGEEIDKKYLSNIAQKTNGKFYYAPKSESLESIFDTISANLNYNLVDVNRDGEDESLLVKDSGFITKINGFAFENFVDSEETSGKTYGMALFAKLYYENILPKQLGNITVKKMNTVETVKAPGYNLPSSISKSEEVPLYEYQFKALNFLSNTPKNYRGVVNNGLLTINTEYKTILSSSGFKIYNQEYTKEKANFRYYENIVLDINSESFESLDSNDKEVIKAIYRLDVLKNKQEIISFKDSPQKCIDTIINSFNDSKVVILKINDNYYVDAIKLISDNENPNIFKIEVYDPNCKAESRYITMERVKKSVLKDNKSIETYEYLFKYMDIPVNVEISIPNVALNL